jgi:MFS transporter, DHA1 family, multidrug resistance protein
MTLGFREFVTLIAALMAMTALSIDAMLPALPAIGAELGVTTANDRQWVISAYMLGFGAAQIVHGPLSDRFGRRPVLIASLLLAAACNLVAALAATFPLLVAARVAAGIATASSRVLSISIVRDCFVGAQMARVMSLATIVFLSAPILAPAIGQSILLVAPWRWIFVFLATVGLMVMVWTVLRLPETLPVERRQPLSFGAVLAGFRTVLSDRKAVGYTGASTALQGALFGFILSIQQIVETTFGRPALLTPVFAAVAGVMAVAAFTNSRIVVRMGPRYVSHRALAAYLTFAAVHLVLSLAGFESLIVFVVLQAAMMGSFSLAGANFAALAMEKMGEIAGTASSVMGLVQTVGGALIGVAIGQAFDGSTVPLYVGAVACALVGLALVAYAESGRLFARD